MCKVLKDKLDSHKDEIPITEEHLKVYEEDIEKLTAKIEGDFSSVNWDRS